MEVNQCAGCTQQFFTKSFLGDDAAVLVRSRGAEPGHAIEQAPRRWRGGRRDDSARTRRKSLISTQECTVLHDRVLRDRLFERVDRDREHGEAAVLDLGLRG